MWDDMNRHAVQNPARKNWGKRFRDLHSTLCFLVREDYTQKMVTKLLRLVKDKAMNVKQFLSYQEEQF